MGQVSSVYSAKDNQDRRSVQGKPGSQKFSPLDLGAGPQTKAKVVSQRSNRHLKNHLLRASSSCEEVKHFFGNSLFSCNFQHIKKLKE